MGAFLDMPAANAALKEYYDDQKVENLAYDENPALAMLPKDTDAEGKVYPIPVIYEVSQGASNGFAQAQGNQSPMQLAEFLLTLKPDYSLATIANQTMKASMSRKGSFVQFLSEYVDVAIQSAANRAGSAVFRAGTGSIGQISSITAAGVVTFANPADIAQFGLNQTLQANSTDGGSPRAAFGWVIARNVMAGTITVSATAMGGAAGQPSGWAANDFLLVSGDNNSKASGFAAWLPTTAPATTDNFYGVNRSVDSRLYGLAYPGAQQPTEEAIIDAAFLVAREKGSPKHFVTNYGSFSAVVKAMGTRREYVDLMSEGEFGFRGVKIQGPKGIIEAFPDRNCQAATGFLLQMNTWKLPSLDPVPHVFKYGDGLEMLRLANGDASEVRCGGYYNLGTRAPGWNSALTLAV